jgi:hypothetical protein
VICDLALEHEQLGSYATTSTDSRSAHEVRVMTRVRPSGPVLRMVLCSKSSLNIATSRTAPSARLRLGGSLRITADGARSRRRTKR